MGITGSNLAFANNSLLIKPFHVSAAVYCEKSYDDNFLRKCDYFIDSQKADIQCLINKDGSNLFVCFRGTDHIKDWRSNLRMKLIDVKESEEDEELSHQFHEGFLNSWLVVKESITKDIKESFDNNKDIETVVFTGHSAGVIANLAAYELNDLVTNEYEKALEAVTFGAPRCCNRHFEIDFEKKIKCTRFVLDRDIITRFPFGNGYRHLGNPIQMRGDEVLNRDTTTIETIKWYIRGLPRFDLGVRDHSIENYVSELRRLVE